MAERVEAPSTLQDHRLADAIRDVKNAAADRDDVVVDIREAQRTRLELLADELRPVFADVPVEDDRFDLAISAGVQPRLWIDAVSHVTMGRDRRTYRFLRDTRLGRVVLAESTDMKPVANQVTRYIAERIVERNRVIEGDLVLGRTSSVDIGRSSSSPGNGKAFLRGLGMMLLGGVVGVAIILFVAWAIAQSGLVS
jgi:hypothetical protein